MKANLEIIENTPIKMLAKYLVTKGVASASRLQRLLFILRWEEMMNEQTTNSVFATNHNFQAWINGPVNVETYNYLRPMFIRIDEKDHYLLNKAQMVPLEQQYGATFTKWNVCSDDDFCQILQTNQAWKQARHKIGANEICTNLIDEQSPDFFKMDYEAVLQSARDYAKWIQEFDDCCN